MSSSAGLPRPASQRPLPFEARKDLSAQQVWYGAQRYWVLKDPLRNELFRLRADQYAIHQLLDGRRSLEDIRAYLASEFRDLSFTLAQLQELVVDLFRKGLVWSTRPGQAAPIERRQRESRRRQLLGAIQSPLFVRLPGWDPQRFLDATYPLVRGLFQPAALLVCAMLVVANWAFVLVRFDEFRERIPAFQSFAQGSTLLMMWAAISAVKVLHELGHAFACRHFGGECHEIGVALMIFSPSMYCDVSDSGRLTSRWARIAIGAAGVCVELVVSSLAFFLWWYTREGLLHQACWAIFFVANISVIVVNLNPLLRLDGYYMLSDWLGIPNLRQKADRLTGRMLSRVCLGLRLPDDPSLPQSRRWLFVAYAVASTLFRWQLTLVITVVLYKALKPFGLQTAGLLLGLITLATSVSRGVWSIVRTWREASRTGRRAARPWITCSLLGAAVVAALTVPFPILVTAPLVVEPVEAEQVYVTTPGRLIAIYARPGQRVKQGDVLAELTNRELMDNFREVCMSYDMQCVAVAVNQAIGDAAQELVAADIRDALYEEAADRRNSLARLKITAPCDGVVIPPPMPERGGSRREGSPPSATPLDAANVGAFLPVGTHLLTVAPNRGFQAVLLVDQTSRDAFIPGRNVRLKLEHAPDQVFHGVVESCSIPDGQYLLPGDPFAKEKTAASHPQGPSKASRISQVTVRLNNSETPIVSGLRGEARLIYFHSSLAAWLWRQAHLTFSIL